MIKRIFFRTVLIAIPVLSIFGLDIAVGYFKETAGIRESRRLFLEEVSQLSIRTLNMVPLLDHGYRPIGDSESPEAGRENSIRYMRTSKNGLILPTESTSSAINNRKPLSILFLGGSTTECNEVHESLRFPAVVGSLLSKSGVQVNISNAGVRGHTTQDSINALLNRPGFREHDIVFLMHNINDRLRLAIQNGYQAQLGAFGQGSGESVKASSIGLIMSLWDWASLRSNMLYLARPFVQSIISVIEKKSEIAIDERVINFRHPNHKSHLEIFRINLGVFVSSVKALGKTPVLMTQALGVHSSEQDDYNNVIREVARTENVRIVDLAKLLGEEASWAFLSDGIHLNNEGSAVIGYLIAKQLATDLKISGKIDSQYLRFMPTLPQDLLSRCAPPNNSIGRAGEPRLLLSRPGRYPSFSPDGKILTFHSYDKEYQEYMMAFHLGKLCISNHHAARFEKMTALSLS